MDVTTYVCEMIDALAKAQKPKLYTPKLYTMQQANKDVKEAKEVNDEKFGYSNRVNTRNGGHIA